MQKFLFDACAMIAFFGKETGGEIVKIILSKAAVSECTILMHNASVAELYYDAVKSGKGEELTILTLLLSYPINFIDNVTIDMVKWMAYFKTTYKISFADSFVLSTAKLHHARVVTSDHHEFDAIDKSGDVSFEWIR